MVGPEPLTVLKVGEHEVPVMPMGKPVVTLVSRPALTLDPSNAEDLARIGVRQYNIVEGNEATDGELLCEMGGRRCYESYDNKGNKRTEDYLATILGHGHGSVLEHAFYVFHLWRVSRGVSHELVRHRAGTSFSQLSTRYVDHLMSPAVEPLGVMCPPMIWANPKMRDAWLKARQIELEAYHENVEDMMETDWDFLDEGEFGDRVYKRKMARQTARSGLPIGSETRMQFGANLRALIHIITMRGDEHADFEIRELACELCEIMKQEAPAVFGGFEVYEARDGFRAVRSPLKKP